MSCIGAGKCTPGSCREISMGFDNQNFYSVHTHLGLLSGYWHDVLLGSHSSSAESWLISPQVDFALQLALASADTESTSGV